MNLDDLRAAYRRQPAIRAILDYVATRKNNMSELTADRLLAVLDTSIRRNDIVQALKDLERLELGTFVVGRRNHKSRFIWRVPMIEAALAARGEREIISAERTEDADEHSAPFVATASAAAPVTIQHRFNLRSDFVVVLDLPTDLTVREATRLSEFVRSLPFDHS